MSARRAVLILAGLLAAVALGFALREPALRAVAATLEWAAGLGPWGAVALAAAWVPAAVLLVPGSILTLGTGFVLGVGRGTVVVSVGSTLGAAAAFAVGRALLRERIRRRLAGDRRFRAIDRAVTEEGFRAVLLLRLSPLFPYNLQNYVFGGTGVRFRDYVVASWIGMLPGTLLYVWLGAGARSLAEAVTGAGASPAARALFVVGLVATAAAVGFVGRRARQALDRREERVEAVDDG